MTSIITDPQLMVDAQRLAGELAGGTPVQRRAAGRLADGLPLPVTAQGTPPCDAPDRLQAMFDKACATKQYKLAHALNAAITELTLVAETPGLPLSPDR